MKKDLYSDEEKRPQTCPSQKLVKANVIGNYLKLYFDKKNFSLGKDWRFEKGSQI